MIRDLMHDPIFLAQRSADAVPEDAETARDLLDTLRANADRCVGMAANMIGVSKRIIVFLDGAGYTTMYNPVILRCSGPYETEEGCLSLSGTRRTRRYRSIRVQYCNEQFQTRIKNYTDYTAQIIQHEIDHCSGILI